jgi:hypothetical protein
MVTDKNMKQLENSMETHYIYLEMFNTCSINDSATINATFKFFPCLQQWWIVNFALEGTVDIPFTYHIGRSHML